MKLISHQASKETDLLGLDVTRVRRLDHDGAALEAVAVHPLQLEVLAAVHGCHAHPGPLTGRPALPAHQLECAVLAACPAVKPDTGGDNTQCPYSKLWTLSVLTRVP